MANKNKILGVNRRYYPNPVQNRLAELSLKTGLGLSDKITNDSTIPTVCVLVEGDVGDYAAYIGHSEDVQWVAQHGNKIQFDEARCHFPNLEKGKYRS